MKIAHMVQNFKHSKYYKYSCIVIKAFATSIGHQLLQY